MTSRRTREVLLRYKGNRCRACGLGVAEMVEQYGTFKRLFEFNHVDPSQKHPDYDNLIRRSVISTEQLDELDKCVLLCDRCHDILHAQNANGTLELTVRRGSRKATQRFNCQVIIDYRNRSIKFLSADRYLLDAYRVKVGPRRPRLMFGTELYANGVLSGLFNDLPTLKRITISTWDTHESMATAEHISATEYRLQSSVGFNVLSYDLCADGPDTPLVWVRNGLASTKDGEITSTATVTCTVKYQSA